MVKRYIYLILTLLISFNLIGCNTKPSTSVSKTQNNGVVADYQSVVENFLTQKNLKIVVNSGAVQDIQLPSDFKVVKDGINVGDLLKQRNELSKQNNLEFSKYMGQKIKMYTAGIETGNSKSNYDVVILIAENKVVGYWIDAGIKDPNQRRADFNVLANLLSVN